MRVFLFAFKKIKSQSSYWTHIITLYGAFYQFEQFQLVQWCIEKGNKNVCRKSRGLEIKLRFTSGILLTPNSLMLLINLTPSRKLLVEFFCVASNECANEIETNTRTEIRMRQVTCCAHSIVAHIQAPSNDMELDSQSFSFIFCTNMWNWSTFVLLLFETLSGVNCNDAEQTLLLLFEHSSGFAYNRKWI